MANRSWVSFHTIETRLDADKEGGGDKLTSATSEAVSTFYDNLPEPVMDTYKTFENGNADLQDRQGFVKKIYPGDWVDFTIRVPIDSTLYQSGGFAPYHLQLQELFGENMGNGGEQLFPALERYSLTVQIQHWLPMAQIPHGNLPLMMLQAKSWTNSKPL